MTVADLVRDPEPPSDGALFDLKMQFDSGKAMDRAVYDLGYARGRASRDAEVAELAQCIRNLVARIDGDGGQRQQGELLAESAARAHLVAAELLAQRDALEHKLVEWRSMHAAACAREATWQRVNDTLRAEVERLRRLGALEHPDSVQRACEAFADIDDEPKKEMGDV